MTSTPKSFIRNDGQVIVAEDFYTTGGKKLSDSDTGPITASQIDSQSATNGQVLTADGAGAASFQNAGGGGAAQSPLQGRSKSITNNADTDLFTFPLADGQAANIFMPFIALAKTSGGDYGMAGGHLNIIIYNDGGTLRTSTNNDSAYDTKNSAGALGNPSLTISASITAGVVTVTINPGNVGSPDTFGFNYGVANPDNRVVTFL